MKNMRRQPVPRQANRHRRNACARERPAKSAPEKSSQAVKIIGAAVGGDKPDCTSGQSHLTCQFCYAIQPHAQRVPADKASPQLTSNEKLEEVVASQREHGAGEKKCRVPTDLPYAAADAFEIDDLAGRRIEFRIGRGGNRHAAGRRWARDGRAATFKTCAIAELASSYLWRWGSPVSFPDSPLQFQIR
jgi:hypothetical protein